MHIVTWTLSSSKTLYIFIYHIRNGFKSSNNYRKLNLTPGGLSELRSKYTFPRCFEGCLAVFHDPRVWMKEGFNDLVQRLRDDDDIRVTFGCHPHFAAQMRGQVFIGDDAQEVERNYSLIWQCLKAAQFLSISCATSCLVALYIYFLCLA